MPLLRSIKNRIVSSKASLRLFLRAVNMPVIGNIYDFFYLRMIRKKIENYDVMVTVEPNNICNLKCIMCPYKDMKRKRESMPMGLFKKIVDDARAMGCKEIQLTQYNEPFTDKFLFERLAYIRKKGMKSSFYSNAVLLNSDKIKRILENPADLIRFSVDGSRKETFEKIRVGANFEKVTENIKKLYLERQKRGKSLPVIEVFFTALDTNRREAREFMKQWKTYSDFASIYPADSRESEKFVGIDYKKLKFYPCFNPKKLIVLSSGKVVLCCVDVDGKVVLGDVRKNSLKEILNSEAYEEIYKSQLNRKCKIEMCKNCSKGYLDSAFQWWFY